MLTKILIFPLTLLVLVAIYLMIVLNFSYSNGERAGYVQKFSSKGWLCKTWEGELTMMAPPGAFPEKFIFTAQNDAVAVKINTSLGKKVALVYEQHKGLPTSCFGDTEYFVTDIKIIN